MHGADGGLAEHPFFSSAVRFVARVAGDSLAVKPSGSHSSGILPGMPPAI